MDLIISETQIFDRYEVKQEISWKAEYEAFDERVRAQCEMFSNPISKADLIDASFLLPHVLAIKSLAKLGFTPDKVSNSIYVAASCGFGPKAFALAGYPMLATDINSAAVEISNNCGVKAKTMSAFQLEFDKNELGMVVSRDFLRDDYLLEYQLEHALYEQWRVLKPGGIVLHYSITPADISNLDRQRGLIQKIGFAKIHKVPFFYQSKTRSYTYQTEVVFLQK